MTKTEKDPRCPVEVTVKLISSKWRRRILRELAGGTKRFGELQRNIAGVSQKVLTQELRNMEKDGLVKRKAYPEVPPRVEYSMTAVAIDFYKLLLVVAKWGRKYCKMMNIPINCYPPKLTVKCCC
ncbi:MAG: helix-turn-helix transcriptional regulator [Rickettsiales bacterium]|jgi:DNA-binding HxlR family transcriptional regulator|nr:helix-turn-helix transcriptional regulator [Rickettsiales bacterium]